MHYDVPSKYLYLLLKSTFLNNIHFRKYDTNVSIFIPFTSVNVLP